MIRKFKKKTSKRGNVLAIRDLISDSPVNTGRQYEFDLARAIPVFFLPFVHTVIECTPVDRIYEPIPFFFNIIIGQPLGAPMFLFAMGACINFSRKSSPLDHMKRGLFLFIAGFLMNMWRFLLPYIIGYGITQDADKFITPLPFRVFGNDVLQFAGLFFLLFGFLQYIKLKDRWIFVIAALMSVAGSFIRHFDTGNNALNIALGHFIGTEDAAGLYVMSDFPLLNWFMVPLCGYLFGKVLLRIKDKGSFYKIIFPIPLIASVIFFVIEYQFGFGQMASGETLLFSENCYYHALWYDAIGYVAFAIGILGAYYFLMKIVPGFLKRFIVSLSRNITRIYVIHWFLVVMFTNVVLYSIRGTQDLPIVPTLLLSLLIFLITYPAALLWERASRKRKELKAS